MTAPVVGFSAEVPKGLLGLESFVQIAPTGSGEQIEITITTEVTGTGPDGEQGAFDDDRCMLVTHDEARQVIAGLASVIT